MHEAYFFWLAENNADAPYKSVKYEYTKAFGDYFLEAGVYLLFGFANT